MLSPYAVATEVVVKQSNRFPGICLALLLVAGCAPPPSGPSAAERVQASPDSDARAIEIAQAVMDKMGGWQNWDRAACVRWRFFGGRLHYWDRPSGDIRIENIRSQPEGQEEHDEYLILMNVHSQQGRVWKNGAELTAGDELQQWLERGHKMWVNDSYWMFMPYKLLDSGVTLRYTGEGVMQDGRAADVLDLTFADVGYTPENRYAIYVARDTGLVEQWDFYASASDEEPRFQMPWADWERFGDIMLATNHGRDNDWGIEVYEELPRSVFESPEPPKP